MRHAMLSIVIVLFVAAGVIGTVGGFRFELPGLPC